MQKDGKARLFLMRDSRVELDHVMQEKKLPTCGEEEIDGYVWDVSNGRKKGEEPVKANDHSMDAMRYMVAQLDLVGRRFQAVVGGQRPVVQTYNPR